MTRVRDAALALRSPWPIIATSSCVVYLALRFLAHEPGAYSLGDTQRYKAAVGLPIFSVRFLAGDRAFLVPLLWKVLGGDRAIIVGQFALSVVAWTALALAVASTVDKTWVKSISLWLVFGLSLGQSVTQWDHDLMSESVALSVCALLFAGAVATAMRPTKLRLALTLLAALAWVMTRDTDAYLGFVAIPALAVALALTRKRLVAAALIGAFAVCAAGIGDAAYAHRGDDPARDAIWIRLRREDPSAITWMKAHGYRGLWATNTVRVYDRYLRDHPLWTLADPLRDRASYATFSSGNRLTALYTPNVRGYDGGRAQFRIPTAVQQLFWPTRPLLLGTELLGILLFLVAGAIRARVKRWTLAALGAATIVGVFPQVLVAWHFSGQEVDRHALIAAAELRIAMILLVVVGLDALAERTRPEQRLRAATP